MGVELIEKLEVEDHLPRNLAFSPKLEVFAFSVSKTILKIKKFVPKAYRKEKKKDNFEFTLRDINSENLFCPIKFIEFQKVISQLETNSQLIANNKSI